MSKSDNNFDWETTIKRMSRSVENIMGSDPSEKVGVAVDLKGHAITAGDPCLVSACHSGLLGIFPQRFRKDSRRASLANSRCFKHGNDSWEEIADLQTVEFFYRKPCLRYQFAEQAGAEFIMLGDR